MYLNKVLLYGNLTRDPELRALPSGMNVVNFSIATNRVFRDRDGKKQEQTDFHNIVVFGRQADAVNQYLKKGRGVFVEGRLQTRSWEKEGQKHYRTEVVADRVQFGPGGPGGAGAGAGGGRAPQADEQDSGGNTGGAGIEYPKDDINPDDIPF
ncbi:single-stranded DNA-binding protein [Candidatus Kaiserbacteria bacterium RIFCSPLOWO2_01_FULL_53_17]|uniref:Single-stranded DNA-binding protein n=1 Tax=Candidatus Kaiserbacteria bacterium RIFCSPLOWO2_01_FULL_53_17 TaxID=1798511 RepID=A0A1F6EH36_9BACT|nr:MAG: single-stranded DNA-binding protein [Candidatus Kaiserbacteria bacterium RIFCSPLOWO2_01_FULL_53_17]